MGFLSRCAGVLEPLHSSKDDFSSADIRLSQTVTFISHTCSDRSRPAILGSVTRRMFQLVAGLVLILITLTPLMESFDHWDKNVVPANDTELNITACFIAAGLIVALAKLLRYAPAFATSKLQPARVLHCPSVLTTGANDRPASTASPPPVALRI